MTPASEQVSELSWEYLSSDFETDKCEDDGQDELCNQIIQMRIFDK